MKTLVFVGPNSTPDVETEVDKHDRSFLFEPLTGPCFRLGEMFAGRDDVTIVQAACGPKDGRAKMFWYNNGLSSSLARVTADAKHRFGKADWSGGTEISVPLIHLGNWLERKSVEHIDSLIIDAQGFDLTILRTLEAYLPDRIGTIRTECDDEGFKHYHGPDNSLDAQEEFLSRFGFAATKISATVTFHPDVLWEKVNANTVFENVAGQTAGVGV